MQLAVECLSEEMFDGLQSEWNRLLDRSSSDTVFLRWEWIHTWWTLFKAERRFYALAVRDQGRLVGIAPLYIDRPGPLGVRQLKLCSDELGPDYLDLIA